MTTAALRQAAMTDAWDDCCRYVYAAVHSFWKRYGGDFQELLSDAQLAFVNAYDDYDPSEGDFRTFLSFRLKGGLFNGMKGRKYRRWQQRTSSLAALEAEALDALATFDPTPFEETEMAEMLRTLSPGAQKIAELCLNPPEEVEADVVARGDQPCNYKSALRAFLTEFRWSRKRITECYEELTTALKGGKG